LVAAVRKEKSACGSPKTVLFASLRKGRGKKKKREKWALILGTGRRKPTPPGTIFPRRENKEKSSVPEQKKEKKPGAGEKAPCRKKGEGKKLAGKKNKKNLRRNSGEKKGRRESLQQKNWGVVGHPSVGGGEGEEPKASQRGERKEGGRGVKKAKWQPGPSPSSTSEGKKKRRKEPI